MISYVISVLVFLAGICFSVFITGGSLISLLDLPSLVTVGIVPFLFASVLFGFKNMAGAFAAAAKKDAGKDSLLKALDFFKYYGKTTWVAAIVTVIIGTVSMLANLEDRFALATPIALALISLLYAGFINAVIILPLSVLLKKQLTGRE